MPVNQFIASENMAKKTAAVKADNSTTSHKLNATDARAHLQFMFGGLDTHPTYRHGRIEMCVNGLEQAAFFRLSDLDKAIQFAERNTAAGSKVYVHCGLIKGDYEKVAKFDRGEPIGHSGGDGVLCWPVLWGEADHKHLDVAEGLTGEARNAARLQAFHAVAREHGLRWGWIQATGTVPTLRLQGFMRLQEPATPDDPDFKSCLWSLSRAGHLDTGATNSSQVLRLCGSLSPAGAKRKDDELGEPSRVTETVLRLATEQTRVALDTIIANLDLAGVLQERGSNTFAPPAKDAADLMSRVLAPKDAEALDRKEVRRVLGNLVRKYAHGWTKDGAARRDQALKLAKTLGGYLWTGAFDPAEVWTDEADGDDPGLSLIAAYVLNGGVDANGMNDLPKGVLDVMASGATKPMHRLPGTKASDGRAFGKLTDQEGANDNTALPTRIVIDQGNSEGTAAQIVKVLIDRGVEVFKRVGQLVVVVTRKAPPQLHAGDGDVTHFLPLDGVMFWAVVNRHVACIVSRKGVPVQVKAPRDVTDSIVKFPDPWPFRDIVAITASPMLRPDGTILSQRGYDEATRTYLTQTLTLPPIPDRPTREDAVRALAMLADVLRGFPFAKPEHRSSALAAMLSTTCRSSFPLVPATLLSAPTPGSGKSYFVDVVAMLATGHPCSAMAAGNDEAETTKRLDAHIIAGTPIISVDNLNGLIAGDRLCQIVSAQLLDVRPLGRSEQAKFANCFTMFINGNNPSLESNMVRRVLTVRLEPNLEQPEQREFPNRPDEDIAQMRGSYIACVFVVMKAWQEAVANGTARPIRFKLASFEQWSDIVRSALVWLGQADPVLTLLEGRETDPKLQAKRDILGAWHRLLGSESVTIAEALKRADVQAASVDDDGSEGMTLSAALAMHLPADKREILSNRLGQFLRGLAGSIANGLRIDAGPRGVQGRTWSVTDI